MASIPLLVPHMPKAVSLLPYLQKIDENQKYTNFGPLNTALELRLLAYTAPGFGPSNITTVANCTVGLELALQALDLPRGAKVLIPAITFVATATAVARIGLEPVIADVRPDTWCLDVETARAAARQADIRAVMPVSTFGYGHDTAGWDRFVDETGIPVVIDAAGAFGNQMAGRRTDVVYSFHATKSLGAGEGGAVLSSDEARIQRIRKLANFGIDTRVGLLGEIGTNGKMSEYHCAVGLASLDEWPTSSQARIHLHQRYLKVLRERCPGLVFQHKADDGVYPLMPVLLPPGCSAAAAVAYLGRAGIDARRWYSPSLSTHPALADAEKSGDLSTALDIGGRILGLPYFLGIGDDQIDSVCTALSGFLKETH